MAKNWLGIIEGVGDMSSVVHLIIELVSKKDRRASDVIREFVRQQMKPREDGKGPTDEAIELSIETDLTSDERRKLALIRARMTPFEVVSWRIVGELIPAGTTKVGDKDETNEGTERDRRLKYKRAVCADFDSIKEGTTLSEDEVADIFVKRMRTGQLISQSATAGAVLQKWREAMQWLEENGDELHRLRLEKAAKRPDVFTIGDDGEIERHMVGLFEGWFGRKPKKARVSATNLQRVKLSGEAAGDTAVTSAPSGGAADERSEGGWRNFFRRGPSQKTSFCSVNLNIIRHKQRS